MRWALPAVALAFLISSDANAVVFGGSNLGFMGYPDSSCRKPYSKPVRPYNFSSQFDIDSYNRQVDEYNFELDHYIRCVKEYVENANNDINRIKEKADDLITDAKSLP
ncbi:MAG TPA: hypothetical protein VHZ78_14960 [Rhizomicrobium sp.]|jgi:hypothetical protein|nr:hypothetical protein [Rhizomicrobium sp.]